MSKIIEVTICEGDYWMPVDEFLANMEATHANGITERKDVKGVIHAIKFDDGTVWDAINGYREQD